MNCAICARYSTHERDFSRTIESQIGEHEQYIDRQGWSASPEHIYVARTASGNSTAKRPALLEIPGQRLPLFSRTTE